MLALMLLALLPLASPQCLSEDDASTDPAAGPKPPLYHGQPAFALSLLRAVHAAKPQANFFFSPSSIYNALLLAYFVSANKTESMLKEGLILPPELSKVNVLEAYKVERLLEQMRSVNGSESYQLINANRLFVARSLEVRNCMENLFHDEMERLDFEKDAEAAADRVNQWVSENTRGHIKQLIPAGHLSPTSKLVLANAAYFKGLWKSKFQPAKTKKETFYVSSSVKHLVTMMRQKGTFNHLASESLGAHVIQLPYKGHAVSMFVLLPPFAAPDGIDTVLGRLTPERLRDLLTEESLVAREVELALPKFAVDNTLELAPILSAMGIGELFNVSADLSSLTGRPEIHLDDAVHKARLEVDEDGATAAAATALFTFRSARPLAPTAFVCNHPFVYLLYDSHSQTVLFAGVYRSPVAAE